MKIWSRVGASGRGFASILSATALAQLISFLVLPLLSRLYSPEAFGVFSLVVAVVASIAPIATLRLESAAMLADEGTEVRAVVRNALTSIVVVGLLTAAAIQVLESLGIWSTPSVAFSSLWVGVIVILTALFSLLSQLALRERRYSLVARRNLYQAIGMAAGQVGAVFLSRGAAGLLGGYVIGRLIGLVSLFRPTRNYFGRTDRASRRSAWRTYWRFPVVFTPSALLNAVGSQAPVIFVVTWFGAGIGGQVGMAERIAAVPLALIGAAAGQVLEAEMSRAIRSGEHGVRRLYLRTSGFLAGAALLCVAGFGLLGGWFVPLLLGSEWQIAGTAVQIMAFAAGVRLVASPMSKIIILYQHSLANSILDVSRVVLIGLAFAAVIALEVPLAASLWLIYGALAVTYVATWCYGLYVTSRVRALPDLLGSERGEEES